MRRTRNYRREVRKQKINQRKQKVKDIRKFHSEEFELGYIQGRKIHTMIFEYKSGLLSKGYYSCIPCLPTKTKVKNAYASYRHRCGYGKAILYSRHDKKQIIAMKQDVDEYMNNSI